MKSFSRDRRERSHRFAAIYLAPVGIGLAWVRTALFFHHGVVSLAIETHGHDGGTDALKAALFNPPMIVWWVTRVPDGIWHGISLQLVPLYVYYAVLTLLLWNAGRSGAWRCYATAAYATHMTTSLLAMFVAGMLGLPRDLVGSFDLAGDVDYLLLLTRQHPGPIAFSVLWLIVWHLFAIGCLVHSWTRSRPLAGPHQPSSGRSR